MKKIIILALLTLSMVACAGEKNGCEEERSDANILIEIDKIIEMSEGDKNKLEINEKQKTALLNLQLTKAKGEDLLDEIQQRVQKRLSRIKTDSSRPKFAYKKIERKKVKAEGNKRKYVIRFASGIIAGE